MIRFTNIFVKITGFLPQLFAFRTKVWYEDKDVSDRHIKGPAVLISNHTSVFDYAVMIFVFWTRTLRYQMAEVLLHNRLQKAFLFLMGGIFVNRNAYDFGFVEKSLSVLKKKGVVGIFPEGYIANNENGEPAPFKPSATYIALQSGAPVIPVYTDGHYFRRQRANVIIGKPIDTEKLWKKEEDEKSNIDTITKYLREKVIELRYELERQQKSRG